MWKRLKERVRSLWNVDTIIDIIVDFLLLVLDVITSPILIVIRLLRHFFNNWIKKSIKRFLKWFAHKVLRLPWQSMYEIKESAQLKKLLFRLTMLSALACFILTKLHEWIILDIEQVWLLQLIDYIMRGNLWTYFI